MKRFFKKEKSNKGVSLIVLVITVVVVILLAVIALSGRINSIDASAIAEYRHELKGVEVDVSTARIQNQEAGLSEEDKEAGFYKTFVENPPADFMSFGSGEYYGYVVNLDKINSKGTLKKGKDYYKYATIEGVEPREITFGKSGHDNDVYIYDAVGKMFYAKGLEVEDGVYYSDTKTLDGPRIDVTKTEIKDATDMVVGVKIDIHATPEIAGEPVTLRIDNVAQNEIGEGTYSYTTDHNGTFRVVAEEYDRISVKNVHVTEIDEKIYHITYHLLDETNRVDVQDKPSSTTVRLHAYKRDGFTLVAWSKNPSASTRDYKPGAPLEENIDMGLYAVWEIGSPKEYTITFNANGGINAPNPIVKTANVAVEIPAQEPTRTGYYFWGWCANSLANRLDYLPGSTYAEDSDIVLYAIWGTTFEMSWSIGDTIILGGVAGVTLHVSPEGTGTTLGAGIKDVGENAYISAIANPGYKFDKWVVNSGAVKLASETSSTTSFKMPMMGVDITANFVEAEYDYTIKYDARGGSGAPATQYKKHDENIAISNVIPSKSGQVFKGWADSLSSVTEKYHPGDFYSDNKSVTLYAIWAESDVKYTVTFNATGGTNAPKSITKPAGTIISIPAQIPVRNNLVFIGWDESINTKTPMYQRNDQYTITRDVTFYAQWDDTEKPEVKISADEDDDGNLFLHGNATDNGGIVAYLWAKQQYFESDYLTMPWVNMDGENLEISIENPIINSGYHYFYVKDRDANVSYASIEVYKMEFRGAQGILVDTKYKASGYAATLSNVIPKRDRFVFDKWQGQSNNKIYEDTEMYNINADEVFNATWILATAWIPSQNEYFLSANDAARTIPANASDYELIELLLEDKVPLEIEEGQKISLDTGTLKLNVEGNAVTIANGGYFRLVKGTIEASEYAIRNTGNVELLEGFIKGKYGMSNAGSAIVGDSSKSYSKNSVKVEGTTYSYVKAATGATLELQNGSFIDTVSFVNASSITPRTGFVYRSFEGSGTKITTITEQINVTNTITAGTNEKVLERKLTFTSDITSRDSASVIQYSEDNSNWVNGTTLEEIIDNKTIYIRTRDEDGVAATAQVRIDDIKELRISFSGNGGSANPAFINVKYKRPYNYHGTWPTATRQYYNFQGWFTLQEDGTEVNSGDIVTITEDQTIYAHWRGIEITVTFDLNGGTTLTPNNTTTKVYYNEPYGTLPTASRGALYEWNGWYLSSTNITESSIVTQPTNHTLTAKWTLLNRAPSLVTDVENSKSTSGFSVRVKATDPDNDKLTYSLYVNGSRKDYETNVTAGTEKVLYASYLSEFTTYNWYVQVTDDKPSGTITGTTKSTKTKCPGGYETTESYTCDGTGYWCTGATPHYTTSTCNNCTNGTLTCNGGDCVVRTSGQVQLECPVCHNNTYNTYCTYHCTVCGADGWSNGGCWGPCHTEGGASSVHPTTYDCPNCDGGVVRTYSYTSPCSSHGLSYEHSYCSHDKTSSHEATRGVWHSCYHNGIAYTGEHE